TAIEAREAILANTCPFLFVAQLSCLVDAFTMTAAAIGAALCKIWDSLVNCHVDLSGDIPSEQCLPFHPLAQRQVPFWHWPCSRQRGSQSRVMHFSPLQPSSQMHSPPSQ